MVCLCVRIGLTRSVQDDLDFIWVSPSAPISGGRPTIADSHLHWQMQLQTYASYFADAVEPRRLGTVALSHVLRSDTRPRLPDSLYQPIEKMLLHASVHLLK